MSGRRWSGGVVVVVALLGLTACEPPPRVHFTVDATASDLDVEPGDGVCATAAGECSLNAAFQAAAEADLGVDITVPDGTYNTGAAVVGDVRVNWRDPLLDRARQSRAGLRGGASSAHLDRQRSHHIVLTCSGRVLQSP